MAILIRHFKVKQKGLNRVWSNVACGKLDVSIDLRFFLNAPQPEIDQVTTLR